MAEYTRIGEAGSSHRPDVGDEYNNVDRHDSFEHEDLPLHEQELDEKHLATIAEDGDLSDPDSDSELDDILDVEKQNRPLQGEQEQERPRSRLMPKWKQYKTYGSLVKSWCIVALPRFCQPGGLRLKKEPYPTAWLDALRGYAAWIVFQYHCFNTYDPSWRRQPFVSVLFAGPGMVALFFVISGYVLSYGLLKHMRTRQSSGMLDSLASATFRRYMRLYASSVVATMFAFVLVRLHLYNGRGLWVPTFFGQVRDWLWNTIFFINPLGDVRGWYHEGTQNSNYEGALWTIPVEFRGSMILFGFCAAVCKLRTPWRMGLTWLIIVLCYLWNTVYVAEFLYGMFVADLSLLRNPDRVRRPGAPLPPLPTSHAPVESAGLAAAAPHTRTGSLRKWSWRNWSGNWSLVNRKEDNNRKRNHHQSGRLPRILKNIGYMLLFLLGIFLLGQPDGTDLGVWGQFPWQFLKSFIPIWYTDGAEYYFYLSMGAFCLLLALDSLPFLQRPLMCGFSQYVGDLSFGIYALHPPLTWAFYIGFADPMRAKYLGDSPLAYIPGYISMTLLVFTAADYFTRLDKKIVRLGRWIQVKLFRKWGC
ncbi:hypothetical protein A1O1_05570 [Capronia coronata CBS 617.96]|uniref:Acyltransferase 3 domain-containing protein n=1 Tax=Capronia coronata CBS 617.96 TaxID=1182541 RepID=W9Z298_9EURO|nr:uncharacterized protein A1O1_05570 [Capronia coronata CBS 617.96]EXJ88639.1 hypothetical protein A1O1_05570 [Capronia coronata CBS 617.96]